MSSSNIFFKAAYQDIITLIVPNSALELTICSSFVFYFFYFFVFFPFVNVLKAGHTPNGH